MIMLLIRRNLEKHKMIEVINKEFTAVHFSGVFVLLCNITAKLEGEVVVFPIECFNTTLIKKYNLFSGNIRMLTNIVKRHNGLFDKALANGHMSFHYYFNSEEDARACIADIISKNVLSSIKNN